MERGDIVKVKTRTNKDVIGVVTYFDNKKIVFNTYFYQNKLSMRPGAAYGYTIMHLEPIDELIFKNALLSEGYSYDVETKTIIHEL